MASSHDYHYLPNRFNRGWKPLPQSISLNLTSWGFFHGPKEVSFSIKLAAFQASGGPRRLIITEFIIMLYTQTITVIV